MASNFFIDKKTKKDLERDLKKRNDIEEEISRLQKKLNDVENDIESHIEKFCIQADDATVLSTLEYYEKRAKDSKKKNLAKEIEERYKNNNLIIEDTLNLIDWYELMCEDYNNKI